MNDSIDLKKFLSDSIYFKKMLLMVSVCFITSNTFAQKLLIPVPLAPPPTSVNEQGMTPLSTPEPERWTKEDLTLDEQYSTAKKEAQAAFYEAKVECQTLYSPDQSICLIMAKSELDREMAAINKRFGLPH